MTTTQAAAHFQVSTRTVRRIAAAYRSGGLEEGVGVFVCEALIVKEFH